MSTQSLFLIAAIWIAIGLVVAFWMRRRGHDFFVWLILGAVLGPLSIPLAVSRDRDVSSIAGAVVEPERPGGFDLLAGLDGSDDAVHALSAAIDLFGDRISSVTLATVLSYEAETTPAGEESQNEALQMLNEVAAQIDIESVETRLLFGKPADALTLLASSGGFELIVVGPRGHGATTALFGSAAGAIVGRGPVPVFVGPALGS